MTQTYFNDAYPIKDKYSCRLHNLWGRKAGYGGVGGLVVLSKELRNGDSTGIITKKRCYFVFSFFRCVKEEKKSVVRKQTCFCRLAWLSKARFHPRSYSREHTHADSRPVFRGSILNWLLYFLTFWHVVTQGCILWGINWGDQNAISVVSGPARVQGDGDSSIFCVQRWSYLCQTGAQKWNYVFISRSLPDWPTACVIF